MISYQLTNKEVHKMNEEAISYIMQKMSNCLDNSQIIRLEKTLEIRVLCAVFIR